MSLLPWIKEPCPYLDRLDAVMEGDFCRMCKRDVYDITALDEAGRTAFFEACSGNACVRYRLDATPALAAALIAASATVATVVAAATPPGHHAPRVPIMLAGIIAPPPPINPPRPEAPPAKPRKPPANAK